MRRLKSAVLTAFCGIVSTICVACAQGIKSPQDDEEDEPVEDSGGPISESDSGGSYCDLQTCDDGKECTVDSCGEEFSCQHIPREGTCTDDASSCTDDVCNSGMCTHPSNGSCPCAEDVDCDDANPCTDDACGVDRKCVNGPNTAACEDDGKECTDDVCAGSSCTHPSKTGACTDDGLSCTDDVCDMDVCTHPRNDSCECILDGECDDGKPCTDDACGEDHKCVHTNSTAACATDNDACTCDVCSMGMCTHVANMSCGGASAIVIDSFDSSADWDANQTTPLHNTITGKSSFDATNLEGNSILYLAESGTATLELATPALAGLTKIVLEMTGYGTNSASMVELGVFDPTTSAYKDRALSLYGMLPDGTATTLEVPIADYAVPGCKITKVRLDFNVTGGQRIWRIDRIRAE